MLFELVDHGDGVVRKADLAIAGFIDDQLITAEPERAGAPADLQI
nr:hypothetical protein [Sphingomonas psychrotolerans]